ncbi:hypothetical protein BI313_14045 [Xanthomonas vesicatoria]|nr:hypothetical protein BI313_14045 [Xanthomonas vesicatoria]
MAPCLRGAALQTAFRTSDDQLSGAVSSPIAGPLAAWMPPSSPHGRFTACPASGEGAARSTCRSFDSSI